MNVVRVSSLMGLIFLAMPVHGMCMLYNVLPTGLTQQTRAVIVIHAMATVLLKVSMSSMGALDDLCVMECSSHPEIARAMLQLTGIAVPLAFIMSLKNDPDFWNRTSRSHRMFIGMNVAASVAALAGLWTSLTS